MSSTSAPARDRYRLSHDEGLIDLWWPYQPLVGRYTVKVASEQTEGRLFQLLCHDRRGGAPPLHVHHREDEGFYIIEGELTFQIGEETIKASPGSFVFGPKDVPHTYTVDSGPAKLLFILSPPGFEECVYATSEPARESTLPPPPEGPPSEEEMEQLGAIVRQYGCEVLG